MRILFILPCIYTTTPFKIPSNVYYPGIASLSAYLKQYGYITSLLQYIRPPTKEQLISQICEASPDIIAFSTTTFMFHYVKKWSRWIKESFDIPIICGGIHPTLDPEGTISYEDIDMVCIGEGEEALLELCTKYKNKEDITNILNIWIKKNGKIYRNPLRPLIEDLDSLPFPDREIFDDKDSTTVVVMVLRGCPFSCSYCATPRVREIYQGRFKRFVRYRSAESIIKYIKEIMPKYPLAERIKFFDDVLNLNKTWFKEFAVMYKKEIGLPYECFSHVSLIDEETVRLFSYSGCRKISFGIESGNDYIRKVIYNRPIERKQIIRAFKLCQDEGIRTYSFNMIGAPFEDMKAILKTIKLNAEIKVSNGIGWGDLPSICYPYPGTKIYQICKENHFLTDSKVDNFFDGTILSQPSIRTKQLLFVLYSFMYFVKLYSLINRLPKKVRKICSNILDGLFLYKRLPYTSIIFLLRLLGGLLYRLYIQEICIRKRMPRLRPIVNILIKR